MVMASVGPSSVSTTIRCVANRGSSVGERPASPVRRRGWRIVPRRRWSPAWATRVGRGFEPPEEHSAKSSSGCPGQGSSLDPSLRSRSRRPRPAGPAGQTPALNDLLGPERDVGGRPIGVGVEVDPARAIAGRDRDGAELIVPRRRDPRGVDAEPSRSVGAGIADGDLASSATCSVNSQRLAPRVDHGRRARHRLARRIEHAADDEHPARRRLRVGVVRSSRRSAVVARPGNAWVHRSWPGREPESPRR